MSSAGCSPNPGFPSHQEFSWLYIPLSQPMAPNLPSMGKMLWKEPLCYTGTTTIGSHCCGNADISKRSKGKGNFKKKNSSAGRWLYSLFPQANWNPTEPEQDTYSENINSSRPSLPPAGPNPPLESCVRSTRQNVWLTAISFINRQSKI